MQPGRSDVLSRLAQALGVRVEDLLQLGADITRRSGPAGKLRKVFEEVSALPRRQQDKVVEFVSAFVCQYRQGQKS